MIRTHHNTRTLKEAMIDYLTSDKVDADASIWNDQSGKELHLFGRRIIHTTAYGNTEYLKFATPADAAKEFDRLSFPSTGDSVIYESFDRPSDERYEIHFWDGYRTEYNDIRHTPTKAEAFSLLGRMHEEHGEFQADWFVSGYGIYEAIETGGEA